MRHYYFNSPVRRCGRNEGTGDQDPLDMKSRHEHGKCDLDDLYLWRWVHNCEEKSRHCLVSVCRMLLFFVALLTGGIMTFPCSTTKGQVSCLLERLCE